MEEKISEIRKEYLDKISSAKNLAALDLIFLALFGKNGVITLLPKDFSSVSKDELKEIGPLFNQLKTELSNEIESKRAEVKESSYSKLEEETLDLDKDVELPERTGHIHPLTRFEQEIVELFAKIGFSQFESPDLDTDDYNYTLVNIPENHPARDLWDTLYIDMETKDAKDKLLMRTHTSNSQIRIMEKFKPPIRMMVLGRCYRYENLDARHEHTFDQFELVYVDKNLSLANLQYLSEYFLKSIVDKDIKVRLRPKYYPFVEPGVGIDGICPFCKGQGCKICSKVGWLELGGAGMIHPTVLKNGGIDSDKYTGIAWGPGLERILMLKYGIEDVRLFRSGDLRFLEKF